MDPSPDRWVEPMFDKEGFQDPWPLVIMAEHGRAGQNRLYKQQIFYRFSVTIQGCVFWYITVTNEVKVTHITTS